MVLTHEQMRVRDLLTETVTLLCKNGLQFKTEIGIEALIGITLDGNEVFLVSIKETISSNEEHQEQSLSCIDGACKEVDDEESFASSEIFECSEVKKRNKCVPPSKKLRKFHRNSGVRSDVKFANSDVREKVSSFKTEMDVEKISERETSSQANVGRSRGCGYSSQSSKIEIKNSYTIASDNVVRIANETTNSDDLMMEAQLSNDSCVIEIKQENSDEEFIPYMELDSLCATSAGELYGASWKTCNKGSTSLLHEASGDQLLPFTVNRTQKKRNQVEVVPGSEVFVEAKELEEMEKQVSGTKLIRRLARAVFPDDRELAFSCCLGIGKSPGIGRLDPKKVDAIMRYVGLNMPHIAKHKVTRIMNNICYEARRKIICQRR